MPPELQVLVLLSVVLVAVSIVASRLKTSPAILLVLAGVLLALTPGLPTVRLAPSFVLLFVLARFPIQHPPNITARDRLRCLHHVGGRSGGALAIGFTVARGICFGRDRLTARCGRSAGIGAQDGVAATAAGHLGR